MWDELNWERGQVKLKIRKTDQPYPVLSQVVSGVFARETVLKFRYGDETLKQLLVELFNRIASFTGNLTSFGSATLFGSSSRFRRELVGKGLRSSASFVRTDYEENGPRSSAST